MTAPRSRAPGTIRFALAGALLLAASACGGGSSTPPPPAGCPAPSGTGTAHSGDITASTTWTAAGSPHGVASGFGVRAGATLTIEPCATVLLGQGAVIWVAGKLVAAGQSGRPVSIDSTGAGVRWGYLTTRAEPDGSTFIDLAYTTLVNGGLTDINGLGLIDLRGTYSGYPRQPMLRVKEVTIDGTAGPYGYGLILREGATFTADSTGLTIKNAVGRPIRANDKSVGSIPPGSYTGNAVDEIVWTSVVPIDEETAIHDRGVPYRLGEPNLNGSDMRVGLGSTGAPLVTLTVDAGVTIKVNPNGRLVMESSLNATGTGVHPSGSLIAMGTAARPITFTSAAAVPASGDWVALWFDTAPAPNARLDHVRVEYAGGATYANGYHCNPSTSGYSANENSAILMFGEPASQFVTNSTITSSAGDGFGRAYTGSPVDFMAGNTFSGVSGCKQGFPRPQPPAGCPSPVPCP